MWDLELNLSGKEAEEHSESYVTFRLNLENVTLSLWRVETQCIEEFKDMLE